MENMELNMKEMEKVNGGFGGSPNPLPAKQGCEVYKIQRGNTLIRIANKFHTTVDTLLALNPTITNKNDITTGFYIYVPKQK